ncbi:TPA: sigma-70 family RNA polymerase sigma factor [Clostridioides difficile]|nr:sigma-70 family RNA polymerase sigma factor [Clostridioides difficile]MDO0498801.1 sigma-70 family RNA polymerase sigma factor [Clostridioides difficile]HCR2111384.1 sigma-70 family RNA polymerase sigma factor [Clostridioides difficile]HCR2116043.1 sigma-70 family RNA polymerase sigma factor [Clostridioides difficile]HCR2120657.1 sigma-70 family RNA polymerase sigma factor [Clostridioides difficile]
MDNQEIIKLVLEFKNGNELAFETLLRVFDKDVKIRANILLKTNFNIDKDDLIQSGYIGIYRGLKNLKTCGETYPKSFLRKCIRDEMYTYIRNQLRKKHTFINEALSIEPKHYEVLHNDVLIEDEVIHSDISKKVINYINYLPEKQQKVMRLYADGFDILQISKLLKNKRKIVEENLYDATECLRELCLDNIYL